MLPNDSRLPAWFEVPSGANRAQLSVKMDYYVRSSGREAIFTLLDSRGREVDTRHARLRGLEPLTPRGTYPVFEIASVNNTVELIEHRRMEPIFYINDDPTVRAKLGVSSTAEAK